MLSGLAQAAALGLLRHVVGAPHCAWTNECLDDVLASEILTRARNGDLSDEVPAIGAETRDLVRLYGERDGDREARAGPGSTSVAPR